MYKSISADLLGIGMSVKLQKKYLLGIGLAIGTMSTRTSSRAGWRVTVGLTQGLLPLVLPGQREGRLVMPIHHRA